MSRSDSVLPTAVSMSTARRAHRRRPPQTRTARVASKLRTRVALAGAAAAALVAALVALAPRLTAADAPSGLKAILEVDREAYYAGDPVPVRISIWNDGSSAVEAPGDDIRAGFSLFDSNGYKIEVGTGAGTASSASAGAAKTGEAAQSGSTTPPRSLAPGAFIGYAHDLTSLYPRLKQAGTYRLQWRGGSLASNAVILKIIAKYDPEKDYTARIETDLGPFTIEFLRKQAPITVKTFVELAQSGFYDGVIFHWVEPDRLVVTGDPTGTGRGGPGFSIPAERPDVDILAGTVIMNPTGQPPANGSLFAVLLAPRPDFKGRKTAFAQVVNGIEVVRQISRIPASPPNARPPHRPIRDVRIKQIVVTEKTS